MNGDHTAEEWAQSAARSAQRSSEKAEAAANAVLEVQHAVGRLERELRETRSQVTVGLTAVRDRLSRLETYLKPPTGTSLTIEDFEETTDGAGVKLTKQKFQTFMEEHQLHEDGRKWRQLWRKVRWLVWTAIGSGVGLAIEQIAKHFL